jgi:hypothetical protein
MAIDAAGIGEEARGGNDPLPAKAIEPMEQTTGLPSFPVFNPMFSATTHSDIIRRFTHDKSFTPFDKSPLSFLDISRVSRRTAENLVLYDEILRRESAPSRRGLTEREGAERLGFRCVGREGRVEEREKPLGSCRRGGSLSRLLSLGSLGGAILARKNTAGNAMFKG